MTNEQYVRWRLEHGSQCSLCPLRGQRKVGASGPSNAAVVFVGEAPGEEEENYKRGAAEYGEPFVGSAGWLLKLKYLAPVGLMKRVDVPGRRWPLLTDQAVLIINVLLCRPPGNKIASPKGRKAVACCRNSAVAFLRAHGGKMAVLAGNTALHLAAPGAAISDYRGRVLVNPEMREWSEEEVRKVALRGEKPWTLDTTFAKEDWQRFVKVLRAVMAFHRRSARKRARFEVKQ